MTYFPPGHEPPPRSGATGFALGDDADYDGPGTRSWEAGAEAAHEAREVYREVMGDRRAERATNGAA